MTSIIITSSRALCSPTEAVISLTDGATMMQQKFLPPREQPYFPNPLFPLISIPLDSKASFLAIHTLIFTNPQSVHRTVYSTYLRSTSSSFVSIIWTKWPIVSHTYTFSYTSPFSSTYITLNNSVTFHIFTLFTGTSASFDRWAHWPLLSHSHYKHTCLYILHVFKLWINSKY